MASTCATLSTAIPTLSVYATSNYQYTSTTGTSFTLSGTLSNSHIYSFDSTTLAWTDTAPLTCDTNWINSGHGFCVMKYEAKNVGGVATSETSGSPWVSITQTAAATACSNLGNGAHLITNAEWMLLARDAENVATNWTTGTVGSGILARGFVNTSNAAVAPNTGTGYEYNTGANTVGSSGTIDYRRTLNLANSQVIWDLSGNVWEWTNNTLETSQLPNYAEAWREINSITYNANLAYADVGPSNNTYTSTNGIGRIYTDNDVAYPSGTTHAVIRGGGWGTGSGAGAFTLYLDCAPAFTDPGFGFRCAR